MTTYFRISFTLLVVTAAFCNVFVNVKTNTLLRKFELLEQTLHQLEETVKVSEKLPFFGSLRRFPFIALLLPQLPKFTPHTLEPRLAFRIPVFGNYMKSAELYDSTLRSSCRIMESYAAYNEKIRSSSFLGVLGLKKVSSNMLTSLEGHLTTESFFLSSLFTSLAIFSGVFTVIVFVLNHLKTQGQREIEEASVQEPKKGKESEENPAVEIQHNNITETQDLVLTDLKTQGQREFEEASVQEPKKGKEGEENPAVEIQHENITETQDLYNTIKKFQQLDDPKMVIDRKWELHLKRQRNLTSQLKENKSKKSQTKPVSNKSPEFVIPATLNKKDIVNVAPVNVPRKENEKIHRQVKLETRDHFDEVNKGYKKVKQINVHFCEENLTVTIEGRNKKMVSSANAQIERLLLQYRFKGEKTWNFTCKRKYKNIVYKKNLKDLEMQHNVIISVPADNNVIDITGGSEENARNVYKILTDLVPRDEEEQNKIIIEENMRIRDEIKEAKKLREADHNNLVKHQQKVKEPRREDPNGKKKDKQKNKKTEKVGEEEEEEKKMDFYSASTWNQRMSQYKPCGFPEDF